MSMCMQKYIKAILQQCMMKGLLSQPFINIRRSSFDCFKSHNKPPTKKYICYSALKCCLRGIAALKTVYIMFKACAQPTH